MVTSSELRNRFRKVVESLDSKSSICDGEIIEILHQDEWLRILVVGSNDSDELPAMPSIVVELSIPRCSPDSGSQGTNQPGMKSDASFESLLAGMIEHLEYLLRLKAAGFNIHVMREDCLWTATRTASEMVGEEVFRVLVPPA